jgi:hypothetical protein
MEPISSNTPARLDDVGRAPAKAAVSLTSELRRAGSSLRERDAAPRGLGDHLRQRQPHECDAQESDNGQGREPAEEQEDELDLRAAPAR